MKRKRAKTHTAVGKAADFAFSAEQARVSCVVLCLHAANGAFADAAQI
jgi:hypothetical protein